MSSEKPVILLIPGAWHQAQTFDPVVSILQAQGYRAEAMKLLSAGGPPSTNLADDAEHIRQTSLNHLIAQGKEVVVVMHSYSGLPGTESVKGLLRTDLAAQGKNGGVVALVYITAFLLKAGESVQSIMPDGLDPVMTFDGDVSHPKNPRTLFYNDLDDETAANCIASLVHQSKGSSQTPLTYEAYRHVPTTYLICKQDAALPLAVQQMMASVPGEGVVRTTVCEAGHSPMLSMPQTVADVIHAAAMEAVTTSD